MRAIGFGRAYRAVTRRAVAAMFVAGALATATSGCRRGDGKVEMDLSTPRSAATVFMNAIEAGDGETAKSAAYAGGVEYEWVEAMAGSVSGMRALVAAAEKKFGAEAYGLVAQRETLHLSDGLRDAEVRLDGNRATILPSNAKHMQPIPMKNVDGKWKLDVGTFTRGEDLTNVVKQLRVVADAAPKLAKDVDADRYQTCKDVQREMQSRVMRQVFNLAEPTTAPATAPAAPKSPQEMPGDL